MMIPAAYALSQPASEGLGKPKIPQLVFERALKKRRDEVIASKDLKELHGVLRQIHAFKRRIRRAMV